MKKIIVALLIAYPLIAKEFNLQTGLLSYTSSTPYKGMPYDFFLVPLISAEYGNFYISGTESGYTFFKSENISLSFELSPTLLGYQSDDSEYFYGMKDRDITLESGIKLEYESGFNKLKLKAVYDFFWSI
jgi:outer membrane scaffolding protein for murein synthesis (MipA/OmpV family)